MFVSKQPPVPESVCVATVYDGVQGPMLQGLLESAGIPSVIRPKYGMDPLPILAGSTILGQEIYVDADRAQEALDLLHAFTSGTYQEEAEEP
ncbi:MAG: DUF2007 domain-containing protein [Candidatus Excrementavichristensenella sp.]|jgi:hypothetical protein